MRLPRISIRSLMASILLIALTCAALRDPSELGASCAYTAALALVLAAFVGAVGNRGRRRSAWLGCALFGGAYLVIAFSPWPVLNNDGLRPPRLPTAVLDDLIGQRIRSWNRAHIVMWGSSAVGDRLSRNEFSISHVPPSFRGQIMTSPTKQLLHSLGAIAFAGLGMLAGRLVTPDDREAEAV